MSNTVAPSPQSEKMRTRAMLVWGLFLAGFIVPFASIAAVIVAYMAKGESAGTVYESHFRRAITLFWLSLVVGIIGVILLVILIGWLVLIALAIYMAYVSIRGILNASDRKSMEASPVQEVMDNITGED